MISFQPQVLRVDIFQVLRVKDQGAAQEAAQCRADFESGTRREATSVERTAKGGEI